MATDGENDPLASLAAELERLYDVQLKLTEATEGLLTVAGSDRHALQAAIGETRAAARASADASASVQSAADERRGRFSR